jgi:hypothetical protein
LDLKGTIQQAATFETITEIYKVLRGRFPTMGARRMVALIRQQYSIRVPESGFYILIQHLVIKLMLSDRKLVNEFLQTVEPEAVARRKPKSKHSI